MEKRMDHTEYPRSLKGKSEAMLRYIIKDAQEAIAANPENPNSSNYYADEINYCATELHRRQRS
jgi:hypothetical protein